MLNGNRCLGGNGVSTMFGVSGELSSVTENEGETAHC